MGHQPKKQIAVTVCGHQLLRPEPSDPTNFWCKVGFHSLADFALPEGVELGLFLKPPRYCTQCFHKEGRVVPPIPKRNAVTMPPVKRPKENVGINEAIRFLVDSGYTVSRNVPVVSNASEGSEDFQDIEEDGPDWDIESPELYRGGKPPGNE